MSDPYGCHDPQQVLSVIGIVLDAIGAIGLSLGLFRGPVVSTFGGTSPTGEEIAAENQAYGVTGGLFLFFGFLLQLLGSIIDTDMCATAEIWAAVITAAVGAPLAYCLYRVARPFCYRRLTEANDDDGGDKGSAPTKP